MAYAVYEELQSSSIPWFDEIPLHWREVRLKWTIESGCKNGVWGGEPNGLDDILCIRVADFDRKQFKLRDDKLTIRAVEYKDRNGRLIQPGDLLLEKSGGGEGQLVGAVSQYTFTSEAVCSNFVASMRAGEEYDSRYITYLHAHLYSSKVNYRSIKQTTGIQNLDSQQYFDEIVFIAALEEQQKIAAFLDYKTQQIDQLIEKKRALIEKLEEKRITVITQAVTKGLDKNAKLKPSGVDWLGDVPEHWGVRRLKFMASIENGRDYKDVEVEEDGYPVYGSGGEFRRASSYLYEGESVLFGRKGTIDKPLYVNGRFWTVDTMFYSEILANTNPSFLYYSALTFQYQTLATQTALPSITQNDLENYLLCYPSMEEQKSIVLFLEKQCKKIDQMLEINNRAMEALEEYRSAIITSAVTGKIDVREFALPKEAA